MRKPCVADLGLLAALLLVQPVSADRVIAARKPMAGMVAQNSAGQEAVPGHDVLVGGAGAVIDGKSRTHVKIDVGAQPVPAQPKLELSLSPFEVVADEPYLIVVEAGEGANAKRLGAASFFPIRSGTVQSFYFDASAVFAEMKAKGTTRADLSLSLAPVERTQTLTSSKVRLVGIRIVGN